MVCGLEAFARRPPESLYVKRNDTYIYHALHALAACCGNHVCVYFLAFLFPAGSHYVSAAN